MRRGTESTPAAAFVFFCGLSRQSPARAASSHGNGCGGLVVRRHELTARPGALVAVAVKVKLPAALGVPVTAAVTVAFGGPGQWRNRRVLW